MKGVQARRHGIGNIRPSPYMAIGVPKRRKWTRLRTYKLSYWQLDVDAWRPWETRVAGRKRSSWPTNQRRTLQSISRNVVDGADSWETRISDRSPFFVAHKSMKIHSNCAFRWFHVTQQHKPRVHTVTIRTATMKVCDLDRFRNRNGLQVTECTGSGRRLPCR